MSSIHTHERLTDQQIANGANSATNSTRPIAETVGEIVSQTTCGDIEFSVEYEDSDYEPYGDEEIGLAAWGKSVEHPVTRTGHRRMVERVFPLKSLKDRKTIFEALEGLAVELARESIQETLRYKGVRVSDPELPSSP